MNPAPQPNAHPQPEWTGESLPPPDQLADQPLPPTSTGGAGSRWLKLGLASVLGLGLGWAGLKGIEAMRAPATPVPAMVVQGPAMLPAATVAQPPAATATASLQATLVMGERTYNLGADQVALPSGSRFQIRVSSAQTGQLSILAVNPQGQASAAPLWSGRVVAGQTVTSGVLRLEGSKGRETLLIQLQPANGAAPLTHSAHLWHL